jgi:ubiquinone/menaquinone biosynthesis C-methylase UbiE
MPAPDVVAYVRAALPEPPARVLEIGAGDGTLAAALAAGGYDVTAIDPESDGDGVQPVALHQLEAEHGAFDAAVAIVSLHHVQPLARSCKRLAEVLKPGAPLIVDEFDVTRLDERAAEWWLIQRRAIGSPREESAAEHVEMMREHIHPVARLAEELAPWFEVGLPVPGPYLYRRHLDWALRPVEEALIAAGELPATGVRFLAVRDRGA